MRYPPAIIRAGPIAKQNGGLNTCRGVVLHSMVGSYAAALGELDKPSRRASWHYSVLKDGRVFAHYEDEVQTWHAGSAYNNDTIGIEHEGGLNPYSEPLTIPQRDASVALVRWLAQAHGFPMTRKVALHEHNEVSGEPTACPSHRIPWEFYTIAEEEDEMKVAAFWSGKTYGPQVPGKPPWEINLAADFGPGSAYLVSVALEKAGTIVFKHGDFSFAGGPAGERAATFTVVPGIHGTAPFEIVGGNVTFKRIAGMVIR